MTIAAGVLCSDGIVICSDTQITESYSKYDRPKIWQEGNYLLVTGSGTSDFMKMAFDKLSASLKTAYPENPSDAREIIENLIRSIYEEHILPFSQSNHYAAAHLSLSLIVGIRCHNDELALVKTALTGAMLVEDYECTGNGSDVFKYWAEYFFQKKMTMEMAGYLCLFMIREAKMAVPGVGGSTQVYKLLKDTTKAKNRLTVWDDTEVLAGFPRSTVQMLMACSESQMEDAEFESRILDYIHRFRALRQALKRQFDESSRAVNTFTATANAAVKFETD
jgi:20S proteasome alpha/beta subunit